MPISTIERTKNLGKELFAPTHKNEKLGSLYIKVSVLDNKFLSSTMSTTYILHVYLVDIQQLYNPLANKTALIVNLLFLLLNDEYTYYIVSVLIT